MGDGAVVKFDTTNSLAKRYLVNVIFKCTKMVLKDEQRAILFSVWERGLLKDTRNYKTVMDITGLTEEEIFRWVNCQRTGIGSHNISEVTTLALSMYKTTLRKKRRRPEEENAILEVEKFTVGKKLKMKLSSYELTGTQYNKNFGRSQARTKSRSSL